ncbi:hypothetical protein PXK01_20045 [Phaeobacter sp. PT47_59]|uniref:hypothetical protein n=1 Tax=Phaeobacter sp. PT47_59 TaxID=3029979 RepID=UPI002380138B|nr:hypothetical protein [Phaeobacter sp. PT47_59]MDE4176450.1 hypothetical protein [Phaeobacter sp. PT47_59]
MSDEDAIPEDYAGSDRTEPNYFRIFFGAITPAGSLACKDQIDENGPFPPEFTTLPTLQFQPSLLKAAVTQDGYVALIAAASGDDGHLIYLHEDNAARASNRFAPPVDLGKPAGVPSYLDTLLINGITNRQNVFVISGAPDNAIWWKFQNPNTISEETITVVPPGTDTPVEVTAAVENPPSQPWSEWHQLSGALCSLTGTQNADGRIILVGLNSSNVPYMNMQTSDQPLLPEHWAGWQDLSGGLSGFEQVVCGVGMNALVHVFARIGSKIYMKVQEQVSSEIFTDWALFASFPDTVQTMALSVASNDGLYLVAQVGSGAGSPVYASYQTVEPDEQWSGLQIIAHVAGDSELVLQSNADMSLSLFARVRATGDVSYLTQQTLVHWSATWVPLGSDLVAMALTQDITVNPA